MYSLIIQQDSLGLFSQWLLRFPREWTEASKAFEDLDCTGTPSLLLHFPVQNKLRASQDLGEGKMDSRFWCEKLQSHIVKYIDIESSRKIPAVFAMYHTVLYITISKFCYNYYFIKKHNKVIMIPSKKGWLVASLNFSASVGTYSSWPHSSLTPACITNLLLSLLSSLLVPVD